jgi:serine/threonine protein kinase/Flp pilus assembly protein TadD
MAIAAGTRLGPYVVTAPLGAGGMGEVYRARDPRLDRDVAIKVLPEHLSSSPEALARLEREARAAAVLSHPNIVSVYDIGRCDRTVFIVMQLLDGETLRDLLRSGPLDWGRSIELLAAMARGLAAAHARGIVHRDLKPENIFVTKSGELKLLDFGIASSAPLTDGSNPTALTMAGAVLGTPGYMSPEQVRGASTGAASDVFSLGCVAYEMVVGRRAFGGATAAESLAALLHEPPPDFQSGAHLIPTELQRIISRCLEKDPDARFGSAQDVAVALERMSSGFEAPEQLDSIAVLPFANSGTPDTEYLSDGITETLINNFSRIPNLRVVPRSVVFRHKASELSPRTLGAALGARLLLSGRVMQRGDRLSVQAELVNAPAEQQLWGERFNRRTADIFEVEDEIARQIAERLHMQLSREDKRALAIRSTEDSEAYRLYLKARFHWRKRSAKDLRLALDYFKQATVQDPSNAQAHAGFSETNTLLVWYGLQDPERGLQAAETAGRDSVRIDPQLAEGHAALGFALAARTEFFEGGRHLRLATELNPGYYLAHDWLALLLAAGGRTQEAMQEMHRARQIDPLSPVIHHHSSWVYLLARRFEDAIRVSRSALDVDVDYPFGHYWLGIASTEMGRHDVAVPSLERAMELLGGAPVGLAALGHACGRAGRHQEAQAILERLEAAGDLHVDPYHLALVRVGLGDHAGALADLRRAKDGRFLWYAFYVRCDPRIDAVRSDATFPGPTD